MKPKQKPNPFFSNPFIKQLLNPLAQMVDNALDAFMEGAATHSKVFWEIGMRALREGDDLAAQDALNNKKKNKKKNKQSKNHITIPLYQQLMHGFPSFTRTLLLLFSTPVFAEKSDTAKLFKETYPSLVPIYERMNLIQVTVKGQIDDDPYDINRKKK